MGSYREYKTPTDLVQDKSVNTDEKIKMLKQWLEDEESRLRASGEGMAGIDRPDLLKQVNNALISIDPNHPNLE